MCENLNGHLEYKQICEGGKGGRVQLSQVVVAQIQPFQSSRLIILIMMVVMVVVMVMMVVMVVMMTIVMKIAILIMDNVHKANCSYSILIGFIQQISATLVLILYFTLILVVQKNHRFWPRKVQNTQFGQVELLATANAIVRLHVLLQSTCPR